MKKLLALLLAVLTIFTLSACSKTQSPSEVLEGFLTQIAQVDYSQDESFAQLAETIGDEGYEKFISMLQDFDYTITNEKIDEDKATVTVEITTYPFGDMILDSVTEFVQRAFVLAFTDPDITDEELIQFFMDIISEKIDNMEKTYTKTIDVNFELQDGDWKIDSDAAKTLTNIISGGLNDAVNNLNDLEF